MPDQRNTRQARGFWLAPASLGVLLILFGVLILVVERLLQFLVAAVFVMAGCSLLGLAWHMRGRVTYRRLDPRWPGSDERDDV
jgi:multisubunit Na+/H+ antiporter MnhG subunit